MIKFFKRYLPKSLYKRVLLTLIVPTILAQSFAIYMFYDRHWNNVRRHLASSLVGEVTMIVSYIENTDNQAAIDKFISQSNGLFSLNVIYTDDRSADKYLAGYKPQKFKEYQKRLKEEIGKTFKVYTNDDESKVMTRVTLKGGHILLIEASDKRLFNSSTYIFILWMIGSTFLLTFIAVIILRNQIRPIIRLARLADNFGRGHELPPNFKPEGAKEIRQAANAFLVMKERISRHIKQRTEMLAGISHDLRTPLTRMKLEIAMMREKNDSEALAGITSDINEMESMVNSYLEFVRGDEGEEALETDIGNIIEPIVAKYKEEGADVKFELPAKPVKAKLRRYQISRVVRNLVENAIKFGTKVEVFTVPLQDAVLIIVDDNGPGIPAAERDDVFKPFYRVERSRNKETGGIGLGLSIVRDIVHAHGGTVELADSEMGGLRAMVKLPA